ncbi:unnamed protein product [Parascedosporium putredinis]|uniref:CENP-V/GFA domain-containing protein n=1 Tax=Parascedosporium putredinis TaxID=1442378 RepID=A0A9P1H235_9PEZI|nr:unnamed protein product [Parascedosporium putredinis]CAI7994372.1 unnamed protein product [Parascedosporium putredinis]
MEQSFNSRTIPHFRVSNVSALFAGLWTAPTEPWSSITRTGPTIAALIPASGDVAGPSYRNRNVHVAKENGREDSRCDSISELSPAAIRPPAMAPYYEDPSIFPMEGGCSCGLIRYRVAQPFIAVHCCHCTSCQRETGSAFALNAIVESASVEQLSPPTPPSPRGLRAGPRHPALPRLEYRPAPTLPAATDDDGPSSLYAEVARPDDAPCPRRVTHPTESGRGQSLSRCPSCGTCLWSHYVGAGASFAFVRAGTLDEAWRIDPDVHIYTRSRRAFVAIEDGKPQFEAFYPSWKELYRPDALVRFEKGIAEARAKQAAEAEKAGTTGEA